MRHTLAAVMLGAALVAPCAAAPGEFVQTSLGPVRGTLSRDGSARMWLGIPYAEPPVGERRWTAPRPPAPWTATFDAIAFGKPCAQIGSIYGPPPAGKAWGLTNVEAFGKPVGDEDCLTLNVWRPDSDARDLPVIVFVHGGGGVAGYSGDPMYEGSRLAVTANAVVVTINMRLGVFASFVHPALEGNDPLSNSGHFGALDIVQSLRFVQDNARAFGGDPGNVTLSGESAGAIAVYLVMASPLATGLFHKAIVMSGLFGDLPPKQKGLDFSAGLVAHLMVHDGLAATPKAAASLASEKGAGWVRQYLLSRSPAELLGVMKDHSLKAAGGAGDGVVMPTDLVAAFEQGAYNRVPTIVGTTREEAKLLAGVFRPSDAERFTIMQTPARAATATASDLIKPYMLPGLGAGVYDTYTGAITALLMIGVKSSLKKLALHAPAIFAYRFDWDRQPEPWHTVYGACHAIDLPFLFGNFPDTLFAPFFNEENRRGREALSQLMMHSVGAFIRSGDPNVDGLPAKWPAWSADGGQKLLLDATPEALAVSVQ